MGTLSDAQRSSLAARLRQGRSRGAERIPPRSPDVHELPPSFEQEQLWFIDQFAPGLSVYNLPFLVWIAGNLDAEALGRALDELAARHETLRTRLINVDGRPLQVIDPPGPRALAIEDLSRDEAAVRDTRLRVLAAREAARPFDLAAGPLFRARLVHLGPDDHVLLVCVHHTVFDGWSLGVFVGELAALYEAAASGQAAALPELPVQYADYALWQRRRLQGEVLEDLVGHWRAALEGVDTVQMPTDRPRPRLQSFDGRVERVHVGSGVLEGLRELGRGSGTTLFVVLLAAIQVLLQRYSGQDDITVGTASANRGRPELASLIGYLVNTLPVRTDLSGDPTFVELLRRVHDSTVQAYAHQELPFAKLVEVLRVERDPSRSPLYQVGFTMDDEPGQEVRAGEVLIHQASEEVLSAIDIFPTRVDLNFFADVGGSEMRIDLSYATALFEEATARRLLEHLRVLLTGVVEDPGRRLSRLPLLTEADLRRELVEWNDTRVSHPVMCLHQCFEEQVERTPRGIAAVLDDERWTYAQLNAHANQLARSLRRRGIVPETLVGICMRPSLSRLAAVLGTLKAGAGYVPLDPELPADRLTYMIQDAGAPLILVDAGAPTLPDSGAEVVDLDRHWSAITRLPDDNPDHPVAPDNVVYAIYTSGSTGRPKGVVVQHATVVNYVSGIRRWLPVGPGEHWLQFASLSFDVSVMDMFVALCSGATAVLGSPQTLHSPPRLAELMRRHRVSFACIPPAVVNLLTEQPLPDLRVMISAGEALSSDLVRSWLRPGLAFYNGYGPTETTCGVTLMELGPASAQPPPIGRPLDNYTAYVLDRHLNPLPPGATGELHVGGACLARGYLDQPGLTAERFIPDPHGGRPGSRLYRTGDLVRRLPDGTIQFIGRIDNQVKLRGLRVELGEIEAVLTTHPAIVQALVVATDDAGGHKQLIGYARTDPEAAVPTPGDLRQHLARQLPSYMVPAHIVLLDAFPLNPSGKIDTAALPDPDPAAAAHAPPRTLLETLVLDLYASLLGQTGIGIDDSFFDLGGNSLQAMRLIASLHAELAVDTDVTAVFLAPTPRRLAALLREQHGFEDAARPTSRSARLVELTGGDARPPLFVVHAIGGTVYPYAQLAHELAGTYKVYGVEAAGQGPRSTGPTSLQAMVSDYVDEIGAAQPSGPYRLAGWSMGGLLAFEIARRLETLGEIVELLVLLDTPYGLPAEPQPTESELAALFVADGSRTLGLDPGDAEAPGPRPAADHLDWLAERLHDGAGNAGLMRAEIERRFEVFKANKRAIAGYRPTATVHLAALIAGAESSPDWAPEWRNALDGPVQTLRVPGDHWTLLQPPGVNRIAEAIVGMGAPAPG